MKVGSLGCSKPIDGAQFEALRAGAPFPEAQGKTVFPLGRRSNYMFVYEEYIHYSNLYHTAHTL